MKRAMAMTVWLATLLGAADAWGQQQEPFQMRGRRWRPAVDGRVRADADGIAGTNVDVRAALDLTDEPDIDDIGAVFHLPGLGRVNYQEWKGSFDRGDTLLGEDLTFSGSTFTAGTVVNSGLDWKVTTMMMEYDPSVVPFYGIPALVSVTAGLKRVRLDSKISSASANEGATLKGNVPVFGFHAKLQPLPYVSVEADVNGLLTKGPEIEGVTGTLLDMSLSAQLTHQQFYGGVGYRWLKVRLEDDHTDVDKLETRLRLRGFFVELGVKF